MHKQDTHLLRKWTYNKNIIKLFLWMITYVIKRNYTREKYTTGLFKTFSKMSSISLLNHNFQTSQKLKVKKHMGCSYREILWKNESKTFHYDMVPLSCCNIYLLTNKFVLIYLSMWQMIKWDVEFIYLALREYHSISLG